MGQPDRRCTFSPPPSGLNTPGNLSAVQDLRSVLGQKQKTKPSLDEKNCDVQTEYKMILVSFVIFSLIYWFTTGHVLLFVWILCFVALFPAARAEASSCPGRWFCILFFLLGGSERLCEGLQTGSKQGVWVSVWRWGVALIEHYQVFFSLISPHKDGL